MSQTAASDKKIVADLPALEDSKDPEKSAERAGLNYVHDDTPGITRRGAGRGGSSGIIAAKVGARGSESRELAELSGGIQRGKVEHDEFHLRMSAENFNLSDWPHRLRFKSQICHVKSGKSRSARPIISGGGNHRGVVGA